MRSKSNFAKSTLADTLALKVRVKILTDNVVTNAF